MAKNANPLQPPVALLVKLGSIAVHVEEMLDRADERDGNAASEAMSPTSTRGDR